ncbi:hypothetical protein B5S28_g222 [[Candida] boidinii]|nr:hypothetical protein B5S28_g222 [[Candida] boidinii]OWB59951.1 hypothetical protein B5S29_g816 [[Candida] boidinii]OWB70525.1 hypothetical protein B5S31_g203 [[Candida] boidinii]GME69077.1 unnamed protein product [[Candida] boidinii]
MNITDLYNSAPAETSKPTTSTEEPVNLEKDDNTIATKIEEPGETLASEAKEDIANTEKKDEPIAIKQEEPQPAIVDAKSESTNGVLKESKPETNGDKHTDKQVSKLAGKANKITAKDYRNLYKMLLDRHANAVSKFEELGIKEEKTIGMLRYLQLRNNSLIDLNEMIYQKIKVQQVLLNKDEFILHDDLTTEKEISIIKKLIDSNSHIKTSLDPLLELVENPANEKISVKQELNQMLYVLELLAPTAIYQNEELGSVFDDLELDIDYNHKSQYSKNYISSTNVSLSALNIINPNVAVIEEPVAKKEEVRFKPHPVKKVQKKRTLKLKTKKNGVANKQEDSSAASSSASTPAPAPTPASIELKPKDKRQHSETEDKADANTEQTLVKKRKTSISETAASADEPKDNDTLNPDDAKIELEIENTITKLIDQKKNGEAEKSEPAVTADSDLPTEGEVPVTEPETSADVKTEEKV